MNIVELVLLAISLSMDAFAVAICRGLALKQCQWKDMVTVGFYFGLFQMAMPLLGYTLGMQLQHFMDVVGQIIPPLVLFLIGGNMLLSAREKEEGLEEEQEETTLPSPSTMIALSLATSIDAFAVGVTFIPLGVPALFTSCFIGCVTFLCSSLGVKIGNVFGLKYKASAELFGGVVLIVMAIRLFLGD